MALGAQRKRVGALNKSLDFVLGHFPVVKEMPFGAGFAVGLVALKFDTPHGAISRSRNGCPFNVFPLVNVPVVAIAADEDHLPTLWRPGWRLLACFRRIGEGHTDRGQP